jgi:two-component system chemotaxis response regulator CheB
MAMRPTNLPRKVVIIGASTGGPLTLKRLCAVLPKVKACVVVIQHMPDHINKPFVKALKKASHMDVKLAESGDVLHEGLILVAPSGVQMELVDNERVSVRFGPPVNNVSPSIDVAMKSLRPAEGVEFVGVILTGMGRDGVEGIRHIKHIGGTTIIQSRETSVLFGAPEAAFRTGSVDFVMRPEEIAKEIATVRVPVKDEYDVVVARGVGRREARDAGFGTVDETRIVTAISELARNIVVHAGGGVMEIRPAVGNKEGKVGLEIVARDSGPGIPDVDVAMGDGYSTTGGLGAGLGGSKRLMDEFEIHSKVDGGTTVSVRKWLPSPGA